MKKIIVGSKVRLYEFLWNVSHDKQSLNENLKQLKITGDAFSLTVKGMYNKKTNYTTTGIATKEDKEEFKTEQSVAALALSAFYKTMKKPDAIDFSGHTIKMSEDDAERAFNLNEDITAKNWVMMFSAEDRDSSEPGYWIGIISNGEPWLVYFDRFITEDSAYSEQGGIIDELKDLISSSEDRSKEFVFLSDRKEILNRFETLFYNSNGLQDKPFESISISFDSLVENIKHPKINKINTSVINPAYIGAALIVAGVGIGVNYYMDYLKEQEAMMQSLRDNQDAEKTRSENLKLQAEYEKLKEKTLKETLAEANRELNEKISIGNPDLNISAWNEMLSKLKLKDEGWELKEVECGMANARVNCMVSLQKGKLAFNKNLMLAHHNITINNDKAIYPLRGDNNIEYTKENYSTLPDSKVFLLDTITLLQKLELAGVKYSTGNLQEITKSVKLPEPPSKMISQNMNVEPIKMGVAAGALKITGKGLYLLDGLKAWISVDPTLKVDRIKAVVGQDGDVSWDITGNYFVKIADAPTLPKIEPSTIGVNIKK